MATSDFGGAGYRRQVGLQLGDTTAAADAQIKLLDTFGKRVDDIAARDAARDRSINKMRYQNLALEMSARAYGEHPTDIDKYRKSYRESLSGYDIPYGDRAEYEGILLNSEARFFAPILLNREQTQVADERQQLLALADNLFADGTFVLGGGAGPAVPMDDNYVGDRYLAALDALRSVDQSGNGILPAGDIAGKAEEYELVALSALAERDVANLPDPVAAAAPYIDGEEYVADIKSSRGAIRLSSNELSGGAREQLRANIRSAVLNTLANRNAREEFSAGQNLINMPANWRGSVEQRHALDRWASVQMDAQPLTADNESLHIDNMVTFARKFSYIPEVYVDLLTASINGGSGEVAVSAAKLLDVAIESGGGRVSKQFDDVTLLRGKLLHDMVWHGAMAPKQALAAVNSIFNSPRSRDYSIELNKKLRNLGARDRANVYGTDVGMDEYGPDGVELYESLVRDYYLMNGGDGRSARSVAKSRIDAIFSYPRYGAYRRSGWIFKSGGRKLKYQPGAYYGEEMEEWIDGDMRERVLPAVKKLGYGDISPENYFLVANLLTVDAFDSGKRQPIWELWYRNEGGNSVQVVDERGDVVVYRVMDPDVAKGVVGGAGRDALRKQAQWYSTAVDDLREQMSMPENERLFLRMIEAGGEVF